MFPKYEYRDYPFRISKSTYNAPYAVQFHRQIEIFLITSGTATCQIDNKTFHLKKGDLYFSFPNVLHGITKAEATAHVLIFDYELCPSFHDLFSHFIPSCPVLREGQYPQIVHSLINRLLEINSVDKKQRRQIIGAYLNVIVSELVECMDLIDRASNQDLVQALIHYFLENFTQDISLDDAANALNYNKYYISHIISGTFQCNFRTLINSFRISLAQNLLISTDKTICEIAFESGFRNQSSFNRIFLKHCKMSPGEFRKNESIQQELK